MNTIKSKRNSGFTIIELMIVLVIVAILLALAYPSYVDYVRRANRGDAQQLLLNWAVNQEIWRANNISYNATDAMKPANDTKYDYSVVAGTNTYTLTADPKGDQAYDKSRGGVACDPLEITESGIKSPPECWE